MIRECVAGVEGCGELFVVLKTEAKGAKGMFFRKGS